MSLCHCVYKTYYRFFAFKNMSLKDMSLCLCNVICTLVLIYKVSRY